MMPTQGAVILDGNKRLSAHSSVTSDPRGRTGRDELLSPYKNPSPQYIPPLTQNDIQLMDERRMRCANELERLDKKIQALKSEEASGRWGRDVSTDDTKRGTRTKRAKKNKATTRKATRRVHH